MPTLLRSPFKLLDPYTRGDASVFFGREAEIQTLYEAVNKNRLVLVYGPSGAGKTSLVECGLASRFDATDWLPFSIRRGENINRSLRAELAKNPVFAQTPPRALPQALERLGARYLRPVYLIFDQFEELLISGQAAEQQEFIRDLQELLNYAGESSCHVLLILREEYLAALYDLEKAIPGLFDRRLRVELMHGEKLAEVIHGSCRAYNISLENPEADVHRMLKNLGAAKAGVALPHLQVYLDMLYRENYTLEYPDGAPENGAQPTLRFRSAAIEALGEIGDVLEKFLDNVEQELRPELKSRRWPEDSLATLLGVFITDEGTKRPLYFDRDPARGFLPREENLRAALAALPNDTLQYLLAALEAKRLLRFGGDAAELAHDSLAAVIDRRRSDEQRRLHEARQRIRNAWLDFRQSGEYLSRRQLNSLETLLPALRLDAPLQAFVTDSLAHARRIENARRWRNIVIFSAITAAFIVSLAFYFQARREQQKAQANLENFWNVEAETVLGVARERLLRADDLARRGYSSEVDSMHADVLRTLEKYPENREIRDFRDSLGRVLGMKRKE